MATSDAGRRARDKEKAAGRGGGVQVNRIQRKDAKGQGRNEKPGKAGTSAT
jgi:hypothetical protein